MVAQVLLSSKRDDWATAQLFYERLDEEFIFDLDAAASARNAKCPRFLTLQENALVCTWPGLSTFINPPYGRGGVGKWFRKMELEIEQGEPETIVSLTAARTDTRWFSDIVWPKADEVRFVKGRIIFELDGEPLWNATFPALVTVFRKDPIKRTSSGPASSIIEACTDREFRALEAAGYFERMRRNQEAMKAKGVAPPIADEEDEVPM
jgi:site-specific DNA-methyltransferase (adenine-specific)